MISRPLAITSVTVAASAAVAPALAADGDRASQRRELQRNRALWARQHLHDYRFRLRVTCFCPFRGRAVTVTVRDGRPHGATDFQRRLDTVPETFAQIRLALDDPKTGEVAGRYDARRGFPRTASIDRIKNAIDDEIGWTVDRFPATTAALAPRRCSPGPPREDAPLAAPTAVNRPSRCCGLREAEGSHGPTGAADHRDQVAR